MGGRPVDAAGNLLDEPHDPPRDLRAENAALSARLSEAVEVIGFYADAGNWAVDRSDMEAPIVCGSDVKLPESICFPHGGARARAFLAKQEGSDE